ncbi:efflux RND transporter permease subunit [bacterium]|nr:efflux RND transporter permease subunit [bacterium]MCP5462687.1 efflux RND transporter permease subunit [bacterium]
MNFARFSVQQRVLVNFAVIIVVVAGAYLYKTIPRENFPLIDIKAIQITTIDPDISSPSDIEDLITIPIEDEIDDLSGIDEIQSNSIEGISSITIKAKENIESIDTLLNDVRQRVDRAKKELPETTEDPVIEEIRFNIPLVTISISGSLNMFEIKRYVDILEDKIKLIRGVETVSISGVEEREIWVEIDQFRLASYGLKIDDVARAIKRKNLNLSSGILKTARGEFQIRALGEIENPQEILDIIIKKDSFGRTVTVKDFAVVDDRFKESKRLSRVNGSKAVTLTVLKSNEADAITLAGRIRKEVDEFRKIIPYGLNISVSNDSSKYIFNRIRTMESSAVMGFILVCILLVLFMNWRISLLTAMGIPVAVCGALVCMWFTGNTINLLTMFGMIMALGMIVDDSIVVVENVFRYIEKGMEPHEAAIKGAHEVFWPVLGSVTTTIAAFSPLVFMSGELGKFMAFIPLTVIFSLIASLFEAFFVLPSHLADFVKKPRKMRKNSILKNIIPVYSYVLKKCLRRRYFFVFLSILTVFLTVAVAKKTLRFMLFQTSFVDEIYVRIDCPERNKIEDTLEVAKRIEQKIIDNLPVHEYETVITTVGQYLSRDRRKFKTGTNVAWIQVDITEGNPKTRHGQVIINELIGLLTDISGATSIEVTSQGGGPPQGQAVELEISGEDFSEMNSAITELKSFLATINGVENIADDFEEGKEEYRIIIDEAKANIFGLDNTDVNRAIRDNFAGLKSTEVRIGEDDIDVILKSVEGMRKFKEDIEGLEIITNKGFTVRLKSIAQILKEPGYNAIYRKNGKRVVKVTADVDDAIITSMQANRLVAEHYADFSKKYTGIELNRAGENEDTAESLRSLLVAFAIAFLTIYMIIGTIFQSFIQPLVVVTIIPFAVVGVLIGFIITNHPLGLMPMLGTIALMGIVVNDSIVMVDFVNSSRKQGYSRWSSIMRAGILRFRPILLTSVTTIIGLLPLIYSGGQTQILAPMAIAISWGLGFGTVLTLLLIPSLLAIVDDIRLLFIPKNAIDKKV